MSTTARLYNTSEITDYILGGKAVFTIVSTKTQTRYTYRVRKATGPGLWFVDVMTGADNENDFSFIGSIRWYEDNPRSMRMFYRHSIKGFVTEDDKRAKAIEYLVARLNHPRDLDDRLEFWHSGICSRCQRRLTTPESIARGLGPVCIVKIQNEG